MTYSVDAASAAWFCLAPADDAHVFQLIHDSAPGTHHPSVRAGTLRSRWPELVDATERGYGVFWTVNGSSNGGRALADIDRIRAVWLDCDGPEADWLGAVAALPPHAIVQSSPGKYHVYWAVEGVTVEEAASILSSITGRWNGDRGAMGLNRVLRIPGTRHSKNPDTPHTVMLLDCCPLPPYGRDAIVAALCGPLTPAAPQASADDWTDAPLPGWNGPLDADALVAYMNRGDRPPAMVEVWGAPEHARGSSDVRMRIIADLLLKSGGNCQAVLDACDDRPGMNKRDGLLRREVQRSYGLWASLDVVATARARGARGADGGRGGSPWRAWSTEEEMIADLYLVLTPGAETVVDSVTGRSCKLKHAGMTFASSTVATDSGTRAMFNPRVMSQLRRYDGVTWDPARPRDVQTDGGDPLLNMWTGWPDRAAVDTERAENYVLQFLAHVEYLVPVARERQDFLSWLAHIAQRPGSLPHQCFYFATPLTGTGRGMLARMLSSTFGAACLPSASPDALFGNGKNGEFDRKLICIIDECRTLTDGPARAQAAEKLKEAITAPTRKIDHKYGASYVQANCMRWLFCTNHPSEGLPVSNGDRRVYAVRNPGKDADDIGARRPQAEYTALDDMLTGDPEAFGAAVFAWLMARDIARYNPNAAAPVTVLKNEMQEADKHVSHPVDSALLDLFRMVPGLTLARIKRIEPLLGAGSAMAIAHAMKRLGCRYAGRVWFEGTLAGVWTRPGGSAPTAPGSLRAELARCEVLLGKAIAEGHS